MSFNYRPAEKFPPAVKNLIMINVLVWVAQLIFDNRMDPVFMGIGYEGDLLQKLHCGLLVVKISAPGNW
ncbi:hypothetical protein [Niabella hibiscisoli]|uniref:hypothetical protein n=1 Tax=Niabella hibiscisoli TaxID=1825928 RepID=UPI001F0FD556|nr:hypothetical protein [Niabella hibiscisoli]MCH5716604.1 hypothetical protein [Niabella hibiscisoli]